MKGRQQWALPNDPCAREMAVVGFCPTKIAAAKSPGRTNLCSAASVPSVPSVPSVSSVSSVRI